MFNRWETETQGDSGQTILLTVGTQTDMSGNWFLRMFNVVQNHMSGEIPLAMNSANRNTENKIKLRASWEEFHLNRLLQDCIESFAVSSCLSLEIAHFLLNSLPLTTLLPASTPNTKSIRSHLPPPDSSPELLHLLNQTRPGSSDKYSTWARN